VRQITGDDVDLIGIGADVRNAFLRVEAIALGLACCAALAVDRALQRFVAVGRVSTLRLVRELANGPRRELHAPFAVLAVLRLLACGVTPSERARKWIIAIAVEDAPLGARAQRCVARRAAIGNECEPPEGNSSREKRDTSHHERHQNTKEQAPSMTVHDAGRK
jgi:hypothetical protein